MSTPTIVHVAGFNSCGFYKRAANVLTSLAILFPSRLKVVEHGFADRTSYRSWLIDNGFRKHFINSTVAQEHSSSPFVWFSNTETKEPDATDIQQYLGGHDDTLSWCRQEFASSSSSSPTTTTTSTTTSVMVDDGHTSNHQYEYDLVVVGGGSGGMAAAKQAATLGAKVACLDFVKPSPLGTKWGLGGTCVNVGCIPKKLFHFASLLREGIHKDNNAFGITTLEGFSPLSTPEQDWQLLRDNIQNHIKSLNFKYRVKLREKNVTYFNKLGTFLDSHTMQLEDKKGKISTITSSRFLIAVGGRPTPLPCEGSELAISSDDVFSYSKPPGKTLCVGASYISLECAGFLAGMGFDVTIAVRSILLRGFDRECSDKIGSFMESQDNIQFKREVTPTKLEKVPNSEQIKVTFSDGTTDVYDTVLGAIGRTADTHKLGLDTILPHCNINPKNGKIIGTHEQSSCPNIYAVGDVLDGTPELTPVAIQAGIKLANRLFASTDDEKHDQRNIMDYINVCTTVFTPIEYGCVGLSEEQAKELYGENNIDVYHSEFVPLEWSLSEHRSSHTAFTKVIVDNVSIPKEQKVVGIHYVGPNAGEVLQGFGISMQSTNTLTMKQLTETVGIHPTNAEEIVTLAITKRSGEDAAAGGC